MLPQLTTVLLVGEAYPEKKSASVSDASHGIAATAHGIR
jgi:hypothetical protein